MNSLVSIITPVYNAEVYIEETIRCVIAQKYQEWELILVDDGSSDTSIAVIQTMQQKDTRIKLLQNNENMGPARTRNLGIEHAKGRYLAFLDSDDIWHPDKLEKQITFMQERQIALSYTTYTLVYEESGKRSLFEVPEQTDYKALLKRPVIGCSTAIYDTKLLGKVYFPIIKKRQDFALWLKILREHGPAYGLQESLVDYAVRPNSLSSNRLSAVHYTWKVYREIEKLPLYKSLYYFTHYALRGLSKYWL